MNYRKTQIMFLMFLTLSKWNGIQWNSIRLDGPNEQTVRKVQPGKGDVGTRVLGV